MSNAFVAKLQSAQMDTSKWALYISPKVDLLPFAIGRHDDPFLPYTRAIFAASHDLVCAYMFDLSAYMALGAAGMVALERSIGLVTQGHVTVLDASFSTRSFAGIWDETAFGVDAVTVSENAPLDAFNTRDDRQAFVVSDSTAFKARFSPANRTLSCLGAEMLLLPLNLLYRARSLAFEATLRELIQSHV